LPQLIFDKNTFFACLQRISENNIIIILDNFSPKQEGNGIYKEEGHSS
jgi:hypothetical protein